MRELKGRKHTLSHTHRPSDDSYEGIRKIIVIHMRSCTKQISSIGFITTKLCPLLTYLKKRRGGGEPKALWYITAHPELIKFCAAQRWWPRVLASFVILGI